MSSILSKFSKSVNISVVVDDKGEVRRAGGRLSGYVILKVEHGNSGSEVEVTLRGKEKAIRKKGPVDLCHQHEFFSSSVTVRDAMRKVLVGPAEAKIPFVVDLPECLPSSSMYRIGLGDVGFNIQYKLTVKLGSSSKSISVGIAAAPLKENGSSSTTVHPTAQTIYSMKGTNQGSITIAASIQSTTIRKGEKLKLSIACRNDSLVKIQSVDAKVVELLNWGSKEGYTKTRVNKETLAKMEGIDLPGLQKESENVNSIVDSNYRTVEEQATMHTAMQKDLVSGINELEMSIPFRARDSHLGVLVDIRHYLKVTFVTNFFGAHPSIKIPLKLGLPEEVPRVYAFNDSSVMQKESVAMIELLPSQRHSVLPVASAVPLPVVPVAVGYSQPTKQDPEAVKEFPKIPSNDFGTIDKEVTPTKQQRLCDLVPMVPSN